MKRFIEYLFARILSIINVVVPKKGNLIVFYDSSSANLSDNTEALYSYVTKNDKHSRYEKVVLLPKGNKKNSKIYCALKFMRAKYVFYSYGDMRIAPSKKQIVVNQWHGSPLKAIGKLTNDKYFRREKLDNFTYLLASSKLFVQPLAKAFGCKEDKVKIVGQARNDYLYDKDRSNYYSNLLKGGKYKKTILWMPTFRVSKDRRCVDCLSVNEETMLPIFSNFNELESLNSYLKDRDILIVIKIHYYATFKSRQYSNIKFVTNEDLEKSDTKLYSFVKDFDSLLTDYSSIYPDYVVLDRPIGFTLDDYDDYRKERGFSIENPIRYMAGNHIYNIKDFYDYINGICQGKDNFAKERKIANKKMNKYGYGSCERLCKLVGIKFK